MKPEILLLLGPNGVGKTTIGHLLQQEYKCKFIGIEQFFLERYPTPEDLGNHFQEAVEEFKSYLVDAVQSHSYPILFEETGVNDLLFSMIQDLSVSYRMVIVHIKAKETVCQKRVTLERRNTP